MNRLPLVAVGVALGIVGAACSGDSQTRSSTPSELTPGRTTVTAPSFPGWPATDFSKTTIDLREVEPGCPARDCIPPLDVPGTVEIAAAQGGHATFAPAKTVEFEPQLPIAVVTASGITKGYPLHVLTWHEVVNDRFGDVPVVVTFCPLCNTAISFDRRIDGRVLDFGVSGNLRNSDLIMWDRQTESWWQQATGEGIAGALAGKKLVHVSTTIVSFRDFVANHPDAPILTEDTGFGRSYGINPYAGYDGDSRPFLFSGTPDPRLPALNRVVTLDRDGDGVAIPLTSLATVGVSNLKAGGKDLAVFWAPGTASALGAESIKDAADIGSAAVYESRLEGSDLTFRPGDVPGTFIDEQTGTSWNIFGTGIAGKFAGKQLAPVFHTTEFWFAWAAFHPKTTIWAPAQP